MKIEGGFGDTWCRQGGIGYPPEIVKISGKWYQVIGSEAHGGTVCHQCSEDRNILYGYIPQRFGQPEAYGSECYRNLIPRLRPKFRPRKLQYIEWVKLVELVKKQYGEPTIIAR